MTLTKQRKQDVTTFGGSITALVPPILCSSASTIAVMIPKSCSTIPSIVGPTTSTPMVVMVLPVVTWPKATSWLPAGEIIRISCEYLTKAIAKFQRKRSSLHTSQLAHQGRAYLNFYRGIYTDVIVYIFANLHMALLTEINMLDMN